jgi:hypothetical protein
MLLFGWRHKLEGSAGSLIPDNSFTGVVGSNCAQLWYRGSHGGEAHLDSQGESAWFPVCGATNGVG